MQFLDLDSKSPIKIPKPSKIQQDTASSSPSVCSHFTTHGSDIRQNNVFIPRMTALFPTLPYFLQRNEWGTRICLTHLPDAEYLYSFTSVSFWMISLTPSSTVSTRSRHTTAPCCLIIVEIGSLREEATQLIIYQLKKLFISSSPKKNTLEKTPKQQSRSEHSSALSSAHPLIDCLMDRVQ